VFERQKPYKRKYISEQLGGGLQDYLPHVDGRVVYGAFSRDLNPDAPLVVLPGDGPEIERWARVFAEQDYPIPVFIKQRSSEWIYMGMFRCVELSEDEAEIAVQAARTKRSDISMILRLARDKQP
jgi:hypothetical protein